MSEADKVVSLGKLVLDFALIERTTCRVDGSTHETDTDHTVMLGVIACSLAAKLYPELSVGKIAQYALVHDLVEVYAGDTPAFNLSPDAQKEKEKREEKAMRQFERDFADQTWLLETLRAYEKLADSEARFVKTLDKCMPKITHVLNYGAEFRRKGRTKEEVSGFFERQHAALAGGHGREFPELMTLMRVIMDQALSASFPNE